MSIWLQVTSGHGPKEVCWAVTRVARRLERDALAHGCRLEWLEPSADEVPDTNHSIVFSLPGSVIPVWLRSWLNPGEKMGTVAWIGQSTFRPHHKRKNWFVGVQVMDQPATGKWGNLEDPRVVTFEAIRSSGPGGQNVNKVSSAIRAVHVPTGIAVKAQDHRDQGQNKKLALERLKRRLQDHDERTNSDARQALWSQHNKLERGNPVKTFRGEKFEED